MTEIIVVFVALPSTLCFLTWRKQTASPIRRWWFYKCMEKIIKLCRLMTKTAGSIWANRWHHVIERFGPAKAFHGINS